MNAATLQGFRELADCIKPMKSLAEYGEVERNGWPYSKTTVLESRQHDGREYTLGSATAGYERAGSMMRWTDSYYYVRYMLDGAINGRRTRTVVEARKFFEAWTNNAL